ncbi:Uncharacterised protein [uncultured archaeon]|nr:Uncharacterised protein [uncultured archaeon]
MCFEYVGLAGMVLIILAWIPETIQNCREKGRNLNLKFVALYLFGSLFLAYHALTINDEVFLALNGLATLIALFNASLILSHGCPLSFLSGGRKKK